MVLKAAGNEAEEEKEHEDDYGSPVEDDAKYGEDPFTLALDNSGDPEPESYQVQERTREDSGPGQRQQRRGL